MDKLSSDVSFYVVSPKKFTVMYVGTLGFYGFYWMYKNWSIYRVASGEKIWPIARAIFFIFFLHSLCSKVTQSESLSSQADLPKVLEWDATKYVLLSILGQISHQSPYLGGIHCLACLMSIASEHNLVSYTLSPDISTILCRACLNKLGSTSPG